MDCDSLEDSGQLLFYVPGIVEDLAAVDFSLGAIIAYLLPRVSLYKACGYLCARHEPPEICPVCKVKKDRSERLIQMAYTIETTAIANLGKGKPRLIDLKPV